VSGRYIVKANAWIAIFSFIGNYWCATQLCALPSYMLTAASTRRYTHYFYRVLKADYTFPAHRLNDVPVSLYFMTHAYFMVRPAAPLPGMPAADAHARLSSTTPCLMRRCGACAAATRLGGAAARSR